MDPICSLRYLEMYDLIWFEILIPRSVGIPSLINSWPSLGNPQIWDTWPLPPQKTKNNTSSKVDPKICPCIFLVSPSKSDLENLSSLKLTFLQLTISQISKGNEIRPSIHPFSGAKMFVSGNFFLVEPGNRAFLTVPVTRGQSPWLPSFPKVQTPCLAATSTLLWSVTKDTCWAWRSHGKIPPLSCYPPVI